jgi:hypothetical protein
MWTVGGVGGDGRDVEWCIGVGLIPVQALSDTVSAVDAV